MCVLVKGKRKNTYAQVPCLLNACSGMKGRKEEGGNDGR